MAAKHRFRRVRGGRPAREPGPAERVQLSFRITPELKRRLRKLGEQTGRSQSQEAEFRIEWSFDRSDLLTDVLSLAYGRQVAGILMLLGSVLPRAGARALLSAAGGRYADNFDRWIDDPTAFHQAKQGVMAILETIGPNGDILDTGANAGVQTAIEVFDALRKKSASKGYEPSHEYVWAPDTVRSLLGSAIVDRMKGPKS